MGQSRPKWSFLAGFLLAAITYFPIFKAITHFANPALEAALASSPVTVIADPSECSFQLRLAGTESFTTSCDIAKSALVARSVNYDNEAAPKGTVAQVKVGEQSIPANTPNFATVLGQAITAHGYPAAADPNKINYPMTVVLLTILVIYVTLVYAPIAAWLVELFPTRIRYSGLSLPYHIGNGWFGGVRHRRRHRQYLFRSVVSDPGGMHEPRRRPAVPAGDEGRRHHQVERIIPRANSVSTRSDFALQRFL